MKSFFYVFIGGGLGSIFRFAISKLISVTKGGFPWPTIFANLIGCFLIGLLVGWAIKNNGERSRRFLDRFQKIRLQGVLSISYFSRINVIILGRLVDIE
jgi:fluoride ion exporter CrcB/FEX